MGATGAVLHGCACSLRRRTHCPSDSSSDKAAEPVYKASAVLESGADNIMGDAAAATQHADEVDDVDMDVNADAVADADVILDEVENDAICM